MCRPGIVYSGIGAAFLAAEAHGVLQRHHDCTFSALIRRVCHTTHPIGRALFLAGLTGGSTWLAHHIVAWTPEVHPHG